MRAKTLVAAVAVVVVVAAAGFFGARWYFTEQVKDRVARFEERLPEGGKVEYQGVDVDLFSQQVTLSGVTFTPGEGQRPIDAEQVIVHEYAREGQMPVRMRAEIVGVNQKLDDMEAKQAATLKDLGYEALRGHYQLAYRYDPANKALNIERLQGSVDEMGSVNISASLTNFQVDPTKAPLDQMDNMFSYNVESLELIYRDDSLVGRILDKAAEEEGVERSALVSRMRDEIAKEAEKSGDQFFKDSASAVSDFLANPQALRITATPKEPVPVARVLSMAMVDPAQLPGAMNIKVEALGAQ